MGKFLLWYLLKINRSSLRKAIINDQIKQISRIIHADRTFLSQALDEQGNTALLLAIQYASLSTVRFLLDNHAHPDQPNLLTFQTPLSFLATTLYSPDSGEESQLAIEMATLLLEHGAYIDKTSPYGLRDHDRQGYLTSETPLMSAVRTRNLPMVSLLVERKANLNYTDKQSQLRPIHHAISNGDVTMFDLLENAGASCRFVLTENENTLLHWFCSRRRNDKHTSLLKRLISQGCDLNAVNTEQQTPLILAAQSNMINTCRLLLEHQVRLDPTDCDGYRAIDLAKPNSKCWKLLDRASRRSNRRSRLLERDAEIVAPQHESLVVTTKYRQMIEEFLRKKQHIDQSQRM